MNGIQEVGQSAKISRRIEELLRLSQSGSHDLLGLAAPVERDNFLLRLLEQRNHFRASFQSVQIIRPRLHHLAPLRQVLCEVVGRADRVALGMNELTLDNLMVPRLKEFDIVRLLVDRYGTTLG